MGHFAGALSFIVMGAVVRFVFRRYGGKGIFYLWAGAASFTGLVMLSIH